MSPLNALDVSSTGEEGACNSGESAATVDHPSLFDLEEQSALRAQISKYLEDASFFPTLAPAS